MPTEEEQICESEKCDDVAAVRIFWPGRPPQINCIACAQKLQNVSAAMGFHLHAEPLTHAH